jgi:hypothetical protein
VIGWLLGINLEDWDGKAECRVTKSEQLQIIQSGWPHAPSLMNAHSWVSNTL